MKMAEKLYVMNRDDWRAWLKKNHSIKKEVWLIHYKKYTGKPSIPYEDAVEEALCYGWIDSTVQRIDDEKFARKFTPRGNKSKWSELNKKRARKMIKQRKMTKAGLAKINVPLKSNEKRVKVLSKKKPIIPNDLKKALATNKKALENFNNFAPSYKRLYIGWITSAKKKETRARRITETVKLATKNIKHIMK